MWKLEKSKTLNELACRFVKAKPFHENTWILLANCFSLNEDRKSALKFLERALHLNPSHSYAHSVLGQEYFFMNNMEKASEHFKKASILNPRQFFAWCGLGSVALKCDKFKIASDYFSRALFLNPKCPVVHSYMGICLINQGDPQKALASFIKAEELDSKNAMNIYQKANALFLLGQYSAALFELEKLKRENAHNESLVFLLLGN